MIPSEVSLEVIVIYAILIAHRSSFDYSIDSDIYQLLSSLMTLKHHVI